MADGGVPSAPHRASVKAEKNYSTIPPKSKRRAAGPHGARARYLRCSQKNEEASANMNAACLLSAAAPWPPSMFS